MCFLPKGVNVLVCIMLPKGVNVLVWIITIIVPMTVLDHYGHHGGMHTLPLTTRTGGATS